jgi:hypothetical protein
VVRCACLSAIATSAFAPNLKALRFSGLRISLDPLLFGLNNNNTTKLISLALTRCELPLSDFNLIATSPCLAQLEMLACTYTDLYQSDVAGGLQEWDCSSVITAIAQSPTSLPPHPS